MTIEVKSISKSFAGRKVLSDFTLHFPEGSITSILGPSGVGKTTLLNIMGGLVMPDTGEILGVTPQNVSYLFQEPRLLPWKTVWGNMDYALHSAYNDKKKREQTIAQYISLVELDGAAHLFPHQLSGGMKQRVAIARSFAFPSQILLMDEPFKGLDLHLKHGLMQAFLKLWRQDKRTVVCVTHDVDEAISLAHHIHVLQGVPAAISESYNVPSPHAADVNRDSLRATLINSLLNNKSQGK